MIVGTLKAGPGWLLVCGAHNNRSQVAVFKDQQPGLRLPRCWSLPPSIYAIIYSQIHDTAGRSLRGQTLPPHCTGAALFADISGFTPLTEAFTTTLGPRRGGAALLRQINQVYEVLLAPVDHARWRDCWPRRAAS